METAAPLLSAIASLLWALFAFTVLAVFRRDISGLIKRVSKASILGQSVELIRDLDKLERSSVIAEEVVDALPKSKSELSAIANGEVIALIADDGLGSKAKRVTNGEDIVRDILEKAAASPKLALISLSAELERKARQALAVRGILRDRRNLSLNQSLAELSQYGFPSQLSGSLKLFNDVRNQIVHGREATDDDALRALDSGIVILRTLSSMPIEINVVYRKDLPLFFDEACSRPVTDATGVMLETTSPGGATKTFRVFPTTRAHFKEGKEVASEWNDKKQWAAAWYRHPDTGVATRGWLGSMEFVGRLLEDI